MKQATLIFIFLLMSLAACSSEDSAPPTDTLVPTPSLAAEILTTEDRLQVERNYERLRQLHTQISTIWESLARGETAQCGSAFEIPSPDSLYQWGTYGENLRLAASELRAAANRWQAECANPRENVPQEIIESGLLEVRAAGDALRDIESYLSQN